MIDTNIYDINLISKDLSPEDLKNKAEIQEFLDQNNIEYSIIDNNFHLRPFGPDRNYEICYVSSKNVPISYPKYNIEGVPKDFFYKLSLEAEENNSFRCWVKDFEWVDPRKKEVLKSIMLHASGQTKKRFYARDFVVKEVPSKEGREFERVNCFYGKRGASLSLGLYLKKNKNGIQEDTLMMIYTFGHNFFGKDNSIEILRVGTKKFHQVIGGASKLLKHFVRNYPVMTIGKKTIKTEKIKFYSDYDHNIGNSMDPLGFEFVNYSKGGFMNYWLESGEVKGRQPAKHKWVMEQMAEGKMLSIPNSGVKTFVMNIDRSDITLNDQP